MTNVPDAAPAPQRPGRVPPHDLQAEESLLGAMLLSRDAIAVASELLSPDDFYKPAHSHVFEAICSLTAAGEPSDAVTVADELRRAGVLDAIGGPALLIALQAGTPATSNAGHYARIIEEHSLLRRLIKVSGEIAEAAFEMPDDVTKTVDWAETRMFDVAQRRVTDSMSAISDLLDANLDHLERLVDRGDAVTGVPTGFVDLDALTAGLQPNALIVIGARPSAGKTAFALSMAAHAAMEANRPVLLFSLEMSNLELCQRLLCAEARVDSKRIRSGQLDQKDWDRIAHATGRLAEAPLWIDDNPNTTIMEIRSKARRLKARVGDLGMVVVDYLQLMTGRSNAESRQVEVSEMSRGLKILARELECPVVALSQLSRQLELRADKRPMLADLRESGCLTADTPITRADTGEVTTMGALHASGERDIPIWTMDERYRMRRSTMTHVFSSGVKTVYELCLASGRRVKASANHPFLALEGWFPLEDLDVGDQVAVPTGGRWPESVGTDADQADDPVVPREVWAYLRKVLPNHGLSVTDLAERWPDDRFIDEVYANPLTLEAARTLADIVGDRQLRDIASADVRWDTIVSISELGDEEVFDATVPGTHNFVAGGVVVHNSIEQDADVVMFIYRDEIYNPESEDRGTAEIIVAKQRNGPTGVAHLAFLDHFTKFANMAKTGANPPL
ncbi:MAG: replicative DNA helicase [Acidimicrobiia bacterium]|nr:replicative DNA helicase [Acidimicrobiia bacterium]